MLKAIKESELTIREEVKSIEKSLHEKIEHELEVLATITKRSFDAAYARFDAVDERLDRLESRENQQDNLIDKVLDDVLTLKGKIKA